MKKSLFAVITLVAVAIGLSAACVQFSKNQNVNAPSQIIAPLPSPSPSASPSTAPGSGGASTAPVSLGIFCYGFGAVPPQTEPNHGACRLPLGYPDIALTASPKDANGIDITNPGQNITWTATIAPASGASFEVDGSNHFNAKITPVEPRVETSVTLTAVYVHSDGHVFTATKVATIAGL